MSNTYNDGKPLTDLERIHELEEMVSALESDNQQLKVMLQDAIGYIAAWDTDTPLPEGEESSAGRLLRQINAFLHPRS